MTYRSKKLRDAARGQQCVACGSWDDTIVGAHMPTHGITGHGTGHKCPDWWLSHLCASCHFEADHGQYRNDIFWRTRMVYRTLDRLFAQGILR